MRLHGRALAKHVEALLHPPGHKTAKCRGKKESRRERGRQGKACEQGFAFQKEAEVKYTFEPGENSICEYFIFNTISKTLNLDKTM